MTWNGMITGTAVFLTFPTAFAFCARTIDVQIVQVCDDAGANCAALDPSSTGAPYSGGDPTGYVYQSEVQSIWAQAGLSVNFTFATWNNSAALDLSVDERADLYAGTWATGGNPSPLPPNIPDGPLAYDRSLQFFFVDSHPGTTSWSGSFDPNTEGRSSGNAQIGVVPQFSTLGRGVMANEGIVAPSLSGVLAHEIGHTLGLRHVDDSTSPEDESNGATGASNDPLVSLSPSTANLMWGGNDGPNYTSVAASYTLTSAQITAVNENGAAQGIITAVPEPNAFVFLSLLTVAFVTVRVTVRT